MNHHLMMLNPTDVSQWKALVDEAEASCCLHVQDDLKSYLVFLLMRYTGAAELADAILALDYLQGLDSHGQVREARLCEVGDKCLLFSGLFPGRAERQRVRISYYVSLGEAAYEFLAGCARGARAGLYHALAAQFVPLMDVLQATRAGEQPTLAALPAIELWSDTGSAGARRALSRHTSGFPVATAPPRAWLGNSARAGLH